MNKPKLAISTAFYKRKELFGYFLTKLHGLEKYFDLHVELTGSNSFENEQELVESHGFNYTYYDNTFLSDKWNHGIQQLKNVDFEYLMILGSDDIISPELALRLYNTAVKNQLDLVGVKDIYFYDALNKSMCYWPGYSNTNQPNRINEPIGAGRLYSKESLNELNYKLFDDMLTCGLDASAYRKYKDKKIAALNISETEYLIDIKTNTNISQLSTYKKSTEAIAVFLDDLPNYIESKILIIMPAYNSSAYIKTAIQSVLAQTYTDFILCIVDDASTDNTIDIINTFNDSRISLVKNTTNKGSYYCRNLALEKYIDDVDYWILHDSDDIMVKERLKLLQNNIGDSLGITSNFIRYKHNYKSEPMFGENGFLWKSVVFNIIGYYDSRTRFGGDSEYKLRFLHIFKNKVKYIKRVLYIALIHNNNDTSKYGVMERKLYISKVNKEYKHGTYFREFVK